MITLQNMIFANPQAYRVFPQIGNPYNTGITDTAIYTGYLQVTDGSGNTKSFSNTSTIDFIGFQGTIDIDQYTDTGSVKLGRWKIASSTVITNDITINITDIEEIPADETTVTPEYEVKYNTYDNGQLISSIVVTPDSYTLQANVEWISIDGENIVISANTDTEPRQGQVTIQVSYQNYTTSANYSITQSGNTINIDIMNSMVLWYDLKRQGADNESMAENPVLRDLSGNGHDATCYNFAWTEESGISTTEYPNALVSNGVDDYAIIGNLPVLNDWTIFIKKDIVKYPTNSGWLLVDGGDSGDSTLQYKYIYGTFSINSFGYSTNVTDYVEKLDVFTPTSFNGNYIEKGDSQAIRTRLCLFGAADLPLISIALYSLTVFNRTLTTEEIEWVKTNLISTENNNLDESLVDAWIFSGLRNEDAPDSIVGEKGTPLTCYNFAWNEEGSGFKDGAMWFDGVDDCLKVRNIFKEPLTDFTIICRREILKYRQWSIFIRDSWTYPTSISAFYFGYLGMPGYPAPGEGVNSFNSINILDIDTAERVSYMTPTNYNGMTISRGTANSECRNLTIIPDGKVACKIKYFVLYNKSLTEEQIQSEIEKLEKIWSNRLNSN